MAKKKSYEFAEWPLPFVGKQGQNMAHMLNYHENW